MAKLMKFNAQLWIDMIEAEEVVRKAQEKAKEAARKIDLSWHENVIVDFFVRSKNKAVTKRHVESAPGSIVISKESWKKDVPKTFKRLQEAGYQPHSSLFTDGAIKEIYSYSQGYPRKIIHICNNALEAAVMKEQSVVDEDVIRELMIEEMMI